MAHRLQFRRDTRARWLEIDPVLMEGEIGFETDTHNGKVGDGVSTYSELEYNNAIVFESITQILGQSTTLVPSQKLVTDEINLIYEAIDSLIGGGSTGGGSTDNIIVGEGLMRKGRVVSVDFKKVSEELNINSKANQIELDNHITYIVDNDEWFISADGTNSISTTEGLNNAFKFASQKGYRRVQLQKGTYLVHANADSEIFNESLVLHSNTEYDFNGATIIQEPHGKQIGSTILLWQCEDTVVRNGIIVGDRETHDYSEEGTHENVIVINIWSGNRITIQDMVVRSCTGDCVLIAGTGSINGFNPNEGAKNVLISNCDLSDARRQGISICNAFDCTVDNCIIHGIGLNPYSDGDPRNGTAPRSAIDIEPWNETFIAELVMRTNITNCKFENNWRHIIEAGPYSYDTKVDSCVFKSETPDKVEYATDVTGGYSGTNRTPDFRESYKNKFPVDVFWDNVNTTVTKCVFINSTLSTVKVAESCIFSGDYNAISVGGDATMIVENCTFEGTTLTGGSGVAKVLNSTINSIQLSQCKLELYGCDVANIRRITDFKTFNTTLRKVRYSLTGEHYGSSIIMDELYGDYTSYANAIFKACKIVFKSFAHTLSPNYYSVFDSCDITTEFAGTAISTSNENSKFINNRVTVSHDNSSYKNKIVAMTNGIVLSNIVVNEIEKVSPVNTFGTARVIKNNTYIGDNLVNENVGDWSEILGTVNEELDAI